MAEEIKQYDSIAKLIALLLVEQAEEDASEAEESSQADRV